MVYGGKSGDWRRMGHLSRQDIKSKAKVVYVCNSCGVWNRPTWDAIKEKPLPPPKCIGCGFMAFAYFQSEGEAKCWAKLEQRQRAGRIEELERQVRIPLLTVHQRTGKPVEWAVFVADFRWRDPVSGDRILAEYKPRAGMSYDASLKIRCCEAAGIPVEIITS